MWRPRTSLTLNINQCGGLAARPLSCCKILRRSPTRPFVCMSGFSTLAGVNVTYKPKPFEMHESGALLHGTKADLAVGDRLVPGRPANYGNGRIANHVYVTRTLDAAVWGAELAVGEGPGRIYVVEPEGALEDDPN